MTREWCFMEIKVMGMLTGGEWDTSLEINKMVYDPENIAPTLTCFCLGNNGVKIGQMEEPVISAMRGRTTDETEDSKNEQRLEINESGLSNTLTTVQKDNMVLEPGIRVRRLTPRECWRLMGFDDDDFDKAEKVTSNSQLYKQAGNSIVVNVLMAIFEEMLQ